MSPSAGTVFLVDDDPRVIVALARLLRAAGFEGRSFSSAAEFLQKHDASVPGCAVLDFAMSGMNGIELQRRLVDTGCERPIVFLTGQGNIPMSVEAMKTGAVDFLTKPVSAENLFTAIRLALEKDQADRLARAAVLSPRLASALLQVARLQPGLLRFLTAKIVQ